MTQNEMTPVRQDDQSTERLPWTTPKVVAMAAGAAADGADGTSDDAVNFS